MGPGWDTDGGRANEQAVSERAVSEHLGSTVTIWMGSYGEDMDGNMGSYGKDVDGMCYRRARLQIKDVVSREAIDAASRTLVRFRRDPPLALTERFARRSGGIQGSWRSGEADGGGALPGQQAFGRADLWTGGEGGVCAHVCMCMRTRTRKYACTCACACACCMCMCMCMCMCVCMCMCMPHVHMDMDASACHSRFRQILYGTRSP